MKAKNIKIALLFQFLFLYSFGQKNENSLLLKTILDNYYKTEKPVYKGRSQLLYLFCNQANNNEEIIEALNLKKVPIEFINEIRLKINTDLEEKNWNSELEYIYSLDKNNLKSKINECLDLNKYQEISKRLHLNNQRLMIISKPLYFSKKNIAVVKVVFYRNIEHNNGAILLLEKINDNWVIKEFLNTWTT